MRGDPPLSSYRPRCDADHTYKRPFTGHTPPLGLQMSDPRGIMELRNNERKQNENIQRNVRQERMLPVQVTVSGDVGYDPSL